MIEKVNLYRKSTLILKKLINFDLFQLSFDINGPYSNQIVAKSRSDR